MGEGEEEAAEAAAYVGDLDLLAGAVILRIQFGPVHGLRGRRAVAGQLEQRLRWHSLLKIVVREWIGVGALSIEVLLRHRCCGSIGVESCPVGLFGYFSSFVFGHLVVPLINGKRGLGGGEVGSVQDSHVRTLQASTHHI